MAMNPFGPAGVAANAAANAQRLSRRLGTPGVGGFTYNPRDDLDVKLGIAASQYGTERVHQGVATPEDVTRYAADHAEELAHPQAAYGGWHPANADPSESEDASYLDISRIYPDRRSAMASAVHNAQTGVYDIGRGQYHPTEFPAWTSQEQEADIQDSLQKLKSRKPPAWMS